MQHSTSDLKQSRSVLLISVLIFGLSLIFGPRAMAEKKAAAKKTAATAAATQLKTQSPPSGPSEDHDSPAAVDTSRVQQGAVYKSAVDENLTIRKITVLPGSDNTDGIYARPLESHIIGLVKSSHRWEYCDSGLASLPKGPLELEENSDIVKSLLAPLDTDAAIVPVVTKGPNGISVRLDLFLKTDGRLLVQESSRDSARFELTDVKDLVSQLYRKLIERVPYEGLVLSRQGSRVTLNLGKSDGIRQDQTISVVQIISENRHPKFGFLISTEKEILGLIKVLKVDDTLSFGVITTEKERGAIRRLAKIAGVRHVDYGDTQTLSSTPQTDLKARADSGVAFGEAAKEWLPVRAPTFGQVGIKASLGSFVGSTALSGVGPLEAKSDFVPMLGVSGELWLNPQWSVLADIGQGILSTTNPRSGSTPGTLNMALSKYSMSVGYNFLIQDDFFGPKFQMKTGLSFYRMFVDDSSPQGLTTVNYSGYQLGLGIYFPLFDQKTWALGGDYTMVLFSHLTESPVTSGDSANNTINEFSFYLERKVAENLRARGTLDFSLYSSSIAGVGTRTEPASSISQRMIGIGGGLIYQF